MWTLAGEHCRDTSESIPECEVTGFCQELKKRGLSPLPEVKGVIAILDQVSPGSTAPNQVLVLSRLPAGAYLPCLD